MLFKSQVFTQASGSIGGQTFSRNRGGMYTRARALPTNPNTARQQAVRAAMTSIVNYWTNTLTDAQRALWAAYAANVPVLNRLGDQIQLTGQQQYIRSNVPAMQAGLPMINDAPTTFDTGEAVTSIGSTNDATPDVVGIAGGAALSTTATFGAPISADGTMLVYLGAPVSPAINYYKGPYRLATTQALVAAAASTNLEQTLTNLVNGSPLVVGQRRGVSLRILYDDGRLSATYRILAPLVTDTV